MSRISALLCLWLSIGLGCAGTAPPPAPRTESPPDAARTTEAADAETGVPDAPPPDDADPAAENLELSNTIRWSTASEVDNFGFDVYRSESPDGPFERLNEDTIEGGGTTDEPREYSWTDDTIDPHTTYYYYVESLSMTGEREKFTPVGKAPAKRPREGDEP